MTVKNKLEEGVIKFSFEITQKKQLPFKKFQTIEKWRKELFNLKLIGEYPKEKVGYGNISCRDQDSHDSFIITGSQTGKLPKLDGQHYTQIYSASLEKQFVKAIGPINPSSESLTHFAIYSANPKIKYVFHIHSSEMWNYMKNRDQDFDFTSEKIDYGTLEMATEVKNLIQNKPAGLILMKGHQDGIISYAESAQDCGQLILSLYKKIHS